MVAADPLDHLAEVAHELLTGVDATLGRAGASQDHPIWPLLRRLGTLPGAAVDAVAALRPAPLAAAGTALRELAVTYAELGATVPEHLTGRDQPGAPNGPGTPTEPGGPAEPAWQGASAEAFADWWTALAAYLTGKPHGSDAGGAGQPGHADDVGGEGLAGRLAATAGYLEATAGWASRTRLALARTLATVLTSAQAVTLTIRPAVTGWPIEPGGGGWLIEPVRQGWPAGTGAGSRSPNPGAGTWSPDPQTARLPYPPATQGSAGTEVGLGLMAEPGQTVSAGVILAAADIGACVLGSLAAAYDEAEVLLATWSGRLDELPFPPAGGSSAASTTTIVVPL